MSKKIQETVYELAAPIVKKLGYTLCEVEYNKIKGANNELVLYIDHQDGIGVEDCETVSTAVDPALDATDPIDQAYVLIVSSLGIDRPITTDAQYEAHVDQKVDVKLYQKVHGSKEFVATLVSFTPDMVTLQTDKHELCLQRGKIALLRPHIEF